MFQLFSIRHRQRANLSKFSTNSAVWDQISTAAGVLAPTNYTLSESCVSRFTSIIFSSANKGSRETQYAHLNYANISHLPSQILMIQHYGAAERGHQGVIAMILNMKIWGLSGEIKKGGIWHPYIDINKLMWLFHCINKKISSHQHQTSSNPWSHKYSWIW